MKYTPAVAACLPLLAASILLTAAPQRPDSPQPASAVAGLTVPDGFEVERVAGPPLVERPIVADFDEEGRLYVADSSGSNDKVDKQLADKPHRIVRLEDTDGDGRFDTSVVFADAMMFPEGTMWLDGSLYVAAPPSIWKLTDTNGDGVADRREEWFTGHTLTGCANDLHGPYLGLDGWIYWTKGAFAQQTYERPGKSPLVTRASHIFRRRPGDSLIEPVMTGGMDNPVDVAFTPAGERIFTATFLEHPRAGRRDAIVHAIYGGVYGKPHAVIDGHPRTGDLMPVMTELGPAVPSGLTRYASSTFGAEYRDNFFAAMFNLRKVTRHVLEPAGATFTARTSDFLVSASRDFHPTDVIEDADGSLLVVDTGPWYKLCCPTSQLAKPDVPGAIYRVRRRGAPASHDARGRDIPWRTLPAAGVAALLDDQRPAVQARALQQAGALGGAAVPALESVLTGSQSTAARRNAVWALTRIADPAARAAVRRGLADREPTVRQAAIHSAGIWRDAAAAPQLVQALQSGEPAIQRAAAEALGRAGGPVAVRELLAVAAAPHDRVLEHSLTYALIEIGDPASTVAEGLQAASPRARRAALIALDQMENGGLEPAGIVPLLDSPDPILRDTAWWIAARHPEWGGALAPVLARRLEDSTLSPAARDQLQQKLVQFGEQPQIQALLGATVGGAATPDGGLSALRTMALVMKGRVKALPAAWTSPLVRALEDRDAEVARHAAAVVRAVPVGGKMPPPIGAALIAVSRDRARPLGLRLEALAAAGDSLAGVDADLFELLRTGLRATQPVAVRAAAASVIEKAALDREQLLSLAASLETAGPLELPRLLRAFDRGGDEALGEALLAALGKASARASVRAETLRPHLAKFPEPVRQKAEALLASINVNSAQQSRRLEALLASVQGGGDVRRGQDVFNSTKGACASCHAIGYMGGTMGPDLTRIGQVRTDKDLLEAIVFPSVSFARGYEPVVVRTASGETHAGMLRADLPDEVVLATLTREETRIARREIVDLQPAEVSLMPAGLGDQLTTQELADLVAFLRAAR